MSCPPELQELLKTLYDLSPAESEVLARLCEEEAGVEELAEALGKDRSTVQRYISPLRAAGLVSRRPVGTEDGRGRAYRYYIEDVAVLKDRVRNRLQEWEEEKLAVLDEL